MNEIKMKLSPEGEKLLKTLHIWKELSRDETEFLCTRIFEEALKDAVAEVMGYNPNTETVTHQIVSPLNQTEVEVSHEVDLPEDTTGISDGLSDDEDTYESEEIPPVQGGPEALIPDQGGANETDMANEMDVEDPTHEAKVSAEAIDEAQVKPRTVKKKKNTKEMFGAREDGVTPEDLFSELSGMPQAALDPATVDHRILRRKKNIKHNAKVREMGANEQG